MYICIWQSLQLQEAKKKNNEKQWRGLFIKRSKNTISENYFIWKTSNITHGFLELQVAVTFLLKMVIADTMETKSWHPIDLDVITSEKQKTEVGLTGVFHYKNSMSYGFVKKIRWNYFEFFQDNNEADETLKVRQSKNCKNVFLHVGEAVLLRKDPVKLLNIVAPSKQF